MERRRFGRSDIELSVLTFGSMGLDPARIDVAAAVRLLLGLCDAGVTSFHSSAEYASYELFTAAVRQLRHVAPAATVTHICKIALPDWDGRFTRGALTARVDAELSALAAERIDVVQWLLRSSPLADPSRLAALGAMAGEFAAEWADLREAGKVGVLASFPYSTAFAAAVLDVAPLGGFVTYLNLAERELVGLLPAIVELGQGVAAIRPLGAGRFAAGGAETAALADTLGVAPDDLAATALRFPLLHPAVASVIVGVSSPAHAARAVEALDGVRPDPDRFAVLVAQLDAADGPAGRAGTPTTT